MRPAVNLGVASQGFGLILLGKTQKPWEVVELAWAPCGVSQTYSRAWFCGTGGVGVARSAGVLSLSFPL